MSQRPTSPEARNDTGEEEEEAAEGRGKRGDKRIKRDVKGVLSLYQTSTHSGTIAFTIGAIEKGKREKGKRPTFRKPKRGQSHSLL